MLLVIVRENFNAIRKESHLEDIQSNIRCFELRKLSDLRGTVDPLIHLLTQLAVVLFLLA